MITPSRRLSLINAFIASAIFAIMFIAVATVVGELFSPFKGWLKESFGHHWVGKGVLSVVVFLVLGILFSFLRMEGQNLLRRLLYALLWFTILGLVVIAGFYAYEAFFMHG